jgi:sugar phosphate isomerase/epimerase
MIMQNFRVADRNGTLEFVLNFLKENKSIRSLSDVHNFKLWNYNEIVLSENVTHLKYSFEFVEKDNVHHILIMVGTYTGSPNNSGSAMIYLALLDGEVDLLTDQTLWKK